MVNRLWDFLFQPPARPTELFQPSKQPRGFCFKAISSFDAVEIITDGRLEVEKISEPVAHGSDRRETLPQRVSDDLQRFVFRRRKKKSAKFLDRKFCFLPI